MRRKCEEREIGRLCIGLSIAAVVERAPRNAAAPMIPERTVTPAGAHHAACGAGGVRSSYRGDNSAPNRRARGLYAPIRDTERSLARGTRARAHAHALQGHPVMQKAAAPEMASLVLSINA